MATKATNVTSETPAETAEPTLHVVTEAFVTQVNGVLVVYKKGQVVLANNPYLRAMPGRFKPFVPEVRS